MAGLLRITPAPQLQFFFLLASRVLKKYLRSLILKRCHPCPVRSTNLSESDIFVLLFAQFVVDVWEAACFTVDLFKPYTAEAKKANLFFAHFSTMMNPSPSPSHFSYFSSFAAAHVSVAFKSCRWIWCNWKLTFWSLRYSHGTVELSHGTISQASVDFWYLKTISWIVTCLGMAKQYGCPSPGSPCAAQNGPRNPNLHTALCAAYSSFGPVRRTFVLEFWNIFSTQSKFVPVQNFQIFLNPFLCYPDPVQNFSFGLIQKTFLLECGKLILKNNIFFKN